MHYNETVAKEINDNFRYDLNSTESVEGIKEFLKFRVESEYLSAVLDLLKIAREIKAKPNKRGEPEKVEDMLTSILAKLELTQEQKNNLLKEVKPALRKKVENRKELSFNEECELPFIIRNDKFYAKTDPIKLKELALSYTNGRPNVLTKELTTNPVCFNLKDVDLSTENLDDLAKVMKFAFDYIEPLKPDCKNFFCEKQEFSGDEIKAYTYLKDLLKTDVPNVEVYLSDVCYKHKGDVFDPFISLFTWDKENKYAFYELDRVIDANKLADDYINRIKEANLSPLEAYLAIYDFVTQKAYERDVKKIDERTFVGALTTDSQVCAGYAALLEKMCERLNMPGLKVEFVEGFDYSDESQSGGHGFCRVTIDDEKYKVKGMYVADPTADCGRYSEYERKALTRLMNYVSRNSNRANGRGVVSCLLPPQDMKLTPHIKNGEKKFNYVGMYFDKDDSKIKTTRGNEFEPAPRVGLETVKEAMINSFAKINPKASKRAINVAVDSRINQSLLYAKALDYTEAFTPKEYKMRYKLIDRHGVHMYNLISYEDDFSKKVDEVISKCHGCLKGTVAKLMVIGKSDEIMQKEQKNAKGNQK